jgi:hypothetical protein
MQGQLNKSIFIKYFMRIITATGFILLLLTNCKKEAVKPPAASHPQMQYLDLNDTAVIFNRSASFDLDKNGSKDIHFHTMLVADPLTQQDKKQWWVTSSFYANLPVNDNEEIPFMQKSDSIYLTGFSGYNWYNASAVKLVQKVFSPTAPPYWEGKWKDASQRFVAIQIINNNNLYNGWVEISFNKNEEKLIIHRAAISKEANKEIKAGW